MRIPQAIQDQLLGKFPKPGKTGIDWYLFCWFLDRYRGTDMLEIGAGEGGSTLSMAAYAKNLTVIDSWEPGWPKSVVEELMDQSGFQIKFIDKKSVDVDVMTLDSYSVVHLDANKAYDQVWHDLEKASKICSGVICVDDYLQSMWPEITWAVDDWLRSSGWHRVLIGNHQVFLSKEPMLLKEIVADWPVVDRGYGLHLTYGNFIPEVERFVEAGSMTYTWHHIQTTIGK